MPNRTRGQFQKKIQNVHWTYGSADSLAQAAGSVGITVFSAQHLPETLLRLRGEVLCYVDGLQAPDGLQAVGVGLILVPEGTGTGVAGATPITDGDAPWIWVEYFCLGYEEMVTDAIDIPGITAARLKIDNKAMRIIRNKEMQFVVETAVVAGGGVSVNTCMNIRGLFGS